MLNTQIFQTIDNDLINSETYEIDKSLRFRASGTAYLNRTPSLAGNRKTWTWSGWIKLGNNTAYTTLFSSGATADQTFASIVLSATGQIALYANSSGTAPALISNRLLRDPSAWYHITIIFDSSNAIANDRMKIYVNGVRESSFAVNLPPTQNLDWAINAAQAHRIGVGIAYPSSYFDGYMADVNFIDGQALDPTYFGRIDSTSGQWSPKKYGGSYGTNGFYLDFKDNTSLTTLGYDKSGNNNHWTTTNISLTAGATYDSMLDTPTNNYPIWNVISPSGLPEYRNAGMQVSTGTTTSSWNRHAVATFTIPSTGKWYWEFTEVGASNGDDVYVGLLSIEAPVTGGTYIGNFAKSHGAYLIRSAGGTADWYSDGVLNGNFGAVQTDPAAGVYSPAIGFAFDADTNILEVFVGGVSRGTRTIPASQSGTLRPAASLYLGNLEINFGQRPFAYTPPSGFVSLCSKNLPTPSIKRGETGFDVATYTGNGGNIQIGEYQFPRFNYLTDRSLRFKGTNSYLNRVLTGANGKTATFSFWIKRGSIGGNQLLFGWTNSGTSAYNIALANDKVYFVDYFNTTRANKTTTLALKDCSKWYHIVCVQDTSNATADDRWRIYIDGVKQTTFDTNIIPTQNIDTTLSTTINMEFGYGPAGNMSYFNGYMADVYFIDGQALTPTSFGEFDANGYWIPKAYAGTYGTNGFYLDFEDNSALANLGYDKSGNSNNWTPNNFSLTGGTTYDSMLDSPTQSYAVLDALTKNASATISNSGLDTSGSNAGWNVKSTLGVSSGKWYWEVIPTSGNANFWIGIGNSSASMSSQPASDSNQWSYYALTGNKYNGATTSAYGAAYTINDVIGVALDMDTGALTFYKNGVSQGVAFTGLFGQMFALLSYGNATSYQININFGQRPFTYTPPDGYKTLSIPNIAEYAADLESPDLVWIKSRNAATNHMLFDSVRGTGKYLISNQTNAVGLTDVNSLIQFNKNGFYLGNNTNINTLNNTYVAWMWKKSISLGIDIVSYTKANSVTETFNHSLGVAPSMMIVKSIETSTENWHVYHKNLTSAAYTVQLNSSSGQSNFPTVFNSTAPTSTQFTIGSAWTGPYQHIAYCFAEIEGFSKFGSYTGNGSADGPFVYCGFKPRFVLIKRIDSTSNWNIRDVSRDSYNTSPTGIFGNLANAESAQANVDIISNGFKCRDAGGIETNTNGGTYIYAAFAETPFKYATAR